MCIKIDIESVYGKRNTIAQKQDNVTVIKKKKGCY